MSCDRHEGTLTLDVTVGLRRNDFSAPRYTVELTVCDRCGTLFLPTEKIERTKAALSARMLEEGSQATASLLDRSLASVGIVNYPARRQQEPVPSMRTLQDAMRSYKKKAKP
jgi:hypothetical protein